MKTLIVDDHKLISEYLLFYITNNFPAFKVTALHNLENNVENQIIAQKPDLVIIDIALKNRETVDFFIPLKQALPNTYFIVYTMHNLDSYKNFFHLHGASAYVLKEEAEAELAEIIKLVISGNRIFPTNIGLDDKDYRLNQLTFTQKEKELLVLLAQNRDTDFIVDALNCTKIDVLNMRKKLLDKCFAKSTQELINYALEYKWLQ